MLDTTTAARIAPQEIIVNLLRDFGVGFWEGSTSPWEMLAEFQGVRPDRVAITPAGEVWIGREKLTQRRLGKFVAWLGHEYPWVVEMNSTWTVAPSISGKGVAA